MPFPPGHRAETAAADQGVLAVAAGVAGRVRLDSVELDGSPYRDFDAAALSVRLPESGRDLTVRARLVPAGPED